MSVSERMRRVNEHVKEVLAETMVELKDPRIGFVTVTEVRTTPDLRHAEVFYTTLEDEPESREATQQGLDSAAPALRRALASSLRLKHTPALHFTHDPVPEHGRHIENLLRRESEDGDH
jgi:ribosome-binding factor A